MTSELGYSQEPSGGCSQSRGTDNTSWRQHVTPSHDRRGNQSRVMHKLGLAHKAAPHTEPPAPFLGPHCLSEQPLPWPRAGFSGRLPTVRTAATGL